MSAVQRARGMPLAGVRVLDLTQVMSGPYCTMMLADMGAEVVKIERPIYGDDLRRTVPYRGRDGHQDYFNALNRSKKSVVLDLKDADQRGVARRLVERADVLVENFSPGTVGRLGLGWDDVRELNPRLVYCSLSGFGQTGPYRDLLALDSIIQAISGLMSVTGEADGEPLMVGAPLADVIAGMFAAYAIVAALRLVDESGGGQYIDLSMQAALLAAVGPRMGETLQAGISPVRLGNENPLRVPANTYRTLDGQWLAVMMHDELQWPRFCEALECPEWRDDARFRTMPLRVAHRAEMNAAVSERFAKRAADDWIARLTAHRIPHALVKDYAQALRDPQVAHRGIVRELRHAHSGTIRVVGPPWAMSVTGTPMQAPPALGQHTDEVLRGWLGAGAQQLGLSQ